MCPRNILLVIHGYSCIYLHIRSLGTIFRDLTIPRVIAALGLCRTQMVLAAVAEIPTRIGILARGTIVAIILTVEAATTIAIVIVKVVEEEEG